MEFHKLESALVFLETPLEVITKRISSDKANKLQIRPMFADLNTPEEIQAKINSLWESRKDFYEKAYIHLNTEFSSIDNLKLQLGLYEKKSAERELYKEKNPHKFNKPYNKPNNNVRP